MNRRTFLRTMGASAAALPIATQRALAALPKLKITRIRLYASPITRPIFNQSFHVVTVETDGGLMGIGEGGSPDTIQDCAQYLIGEDPIRAEHLWQMMYRGRFYPAGREKLHALGAIDLALWDLKGKALGVPVYELLGGLTREYVECYSTGFPRQGDTKETARACMEAGFRGFRTSVADPGSGQAFVPQQMVRRTFEHCQQIREGVGKDGDWAIDYHTRLDFPDAVRLSTLLEPLEPLFVEDLVRSENIDVYKTLRPLVKVPIAVGEQFGSKWDQNALIELHLMDYNRSTIPNVGGLTEYRKIAAMCETHYVGLVPHFTGPISEAALVHVCASSSGPALMEMTGNGMPEIPYLPQGFDFRKGKMYPNQRPGLGVTVDFNRLQKIAEVTTGAKPIPMFRRSDGSITNW